MSKPSASTYLRDGAEVFTMEIDKAPPKGQRFFIQQKAPTNTSGRMFVALRGTPEVLAALEMRTRTAGGDVVCIMRDDGIAIYAGRGEIDSLDENPAVVERTTTTMTRRDDGTVSKSVTMNAREETRHSAQLVWAGRIWSEEIIMLNALPDECRADVDASSVGEPVQGWAATDIAAGQLALLKTPLERAERNSLLAVQYEVAQIMGAQFAHRRTSEATKQARGAKRIPLEARQVNAMTVRHRDAITRKRLIEERVLSVSTKLDASSRTRITISLDSGTSRGKVAKLQIQLPLFPTEGCEGDIGLLALEEMARNRDQAQARRMLALITILTENRGGIEWNEEGKRWLRLQAMALIGQPAAKASKAQSDFMRAEIERLETEALLVSPYGRKRSKRSRGETERVSILTVTRTSGETGEATRIALNPELAESMMGKGRGVWMPRDAFALPESDGGYAFTLAFTLIMRWQVGAAKGWESFEKTMETAGMLGAFKQRAETQGVRDAREWLEGLLVQLRPMMGVVEIDWARGRFIFAQRPKWLTFKRGALLLDSDSDNVRLGAASDPA
jgi:hypothetical protein